MTCSDEGLTFHLIWSCLWLIFTAPLQRRAAGVGAATSRRTHTSFMLPPMFYAYGCLSCCPLSACSAKTSDDLETNTESRPFGAQRSKHQWQEHIGGEGRRQQPHLNKEKQKVNRSYYFSRVHIIQTFLIYLFYSEYIKTSFRLWINWISNNVFSKVSLQLHEWSHQNRRKLTDLI